MFSSIARFVESSLDELEQQGRNRQAVFQQTGRTSSDSFLSSPSRTARPSGAARQLESVEGARNAGSASTLELGNSDINDGQLTRSANAASASAESLPSSKPTPSVTPDRPKTSAGPPAASPGGLGNRQYRDQNGSGSGSGIDSFPSFKLSNLKRSLSGTLGNLDNLVNSLDLNINAPSASTLVSPSTPSRDSSEWPAIPFPGAALPVSSPGSVYSNNRQFLAGIARNDTYGSPAGSGGSRLKRRNSARAASISGVSGFDSLTGPFSPHTMHQQDPFFFASLQGLPDELKQAAFTPLPKEDEDEELDQIDAELSGTGLKKSEAKMAGLGIGTPSSRIAVHGRSASMGSFRPASAPAGGFFTIPPARVATPPNIRSPLAEPMPSLMQHILAEADEPPSNAPSVVHTPTAAYANLPVEEGVREVENTDPSSNAESEVDISSVNDTGAITVKTEDLLPIVNDTETTTVKTEDPLARELDTSHIQPTFDTAANQSHERTMDVTQADVNMATETSLRSAQAADHDATTVQRAATTSERVIAQNDPLSASSLSSEASAGVSAMSPPGQGPGGIAKPSIQASQLIMKPVAPQIIRAPSPAAPRQEPSIVAPIAASPASSPVKKGISLADRLARVARATSPLPRKSIEEERPPSPSHLAPAVATGAPTQSPLESETATPSKEAERLNEILPVYKRLQADKVAVDKLLRQYTAVRSISDTEALETFLKSMQDLATASKQSEELRKQLSSEQQRTASLQTDLAESKAATVKAEAKSKDEEEKKAKSISLLKAVRQKLIKAEKDKEEAEIMRDASKNSEEQYAAEVKGMKQRYDQETLAMRTAQEQQLTKLRGSFDREVTSIRSTYEREANARRSQHESELANVRSVHARESSQRDDRISGLEAGLRELRNDKSSLFEQSQLRQAEVENAVAEKERIQVALDELRYELKESHDRNTMLQEEVAGFKRARLEQSREESHVRQTVADAESRHADKIRAFEDRINALEAERNDAEELMAKQLQDKLREVDRMRREIDARDALNNEETQRREERQLRTDRAESLVRQLQEKVAALDMLLTEAQSEAARSKDGEATVQELLADQTRRVAELESRNQDLQHKETSLRTNNKTLREELRKIQSGVLLSERSRNPGVGYFSNMAGASTPSIADGRSPPITPINGPTSQTRNMGVNGSDLREAKTASDSIETATGVPNSKNGEYARSDASRPSSNSISDEHALNFEYIRNVIMQFLEHKEMRPHLVSVLGIILHFTPAETRRLASKANA